VREFGSYAVLRDDFRRPDESPLANRLGWNGNMVSTDSDLALTSNALVAAGADRSAAYTYTLADCEATIHVQTSDSNLKYLFVRAQDVDTTGLDGYAVVAVTSTSLRLQRWNNGAATNIGNLGVIPTTAPFEIGIRALGAALEGYWRAVGGLWVRYVVATDSAFSSGVSGVRASGPATFQAFWFGAITDNIQPAQVFTGSIA